MRKTFCIVFCLAAVCGGLRAAPDTVNDVVKAQAGASGSDAATRPGAEYYVSCSRGDDANSGRDADHPWKTLSKLSAQTFSPGDTVYLRSGDTWKGDTFAPQGSASAAGWITVTAYDKGKYPKLVMPGAKPVLSLDGRASGWKFVNLDFSGSGNAFFSDNKTKTGQHDIWIENCRFTGCSASIASEWGSPETTSVTIKGCSATGGQYRLHRVRDSLLTGSKTDHTPLAALALTHCVNVCVDNCTFTNAGEAGSKAGTAAAYVAVCSKIVFQNCEIAFTKRPSGPDGVAIDFEGNDTDCTVRSCKLHDNMGAAVLIYRNPQWGSDNANLSFVGNTVWNNGQISPTTVPAFIRIYHNDNCGGSITGNDIKLSSGQAVNTISDRPTSDFPPSFDVSGNTTGSEGG